MIDTIISKLQMVLTSWKHQAPTDGTLATATVGNIDSYGQEPIKDYEYKDQPGVPVTDAHHHGDTHDHSADTHGGTAHHHGDTHDHSADTHGLGAAEPAGRSAEEVEEGKGNLYYKNTAGNFGGAVVVSSSSQWSETDSIYTRNYAKIEGGAVGTMKKMAQTPRFTFYYSIAKDDVKFTPINDDKEHPHHMRAKEFKLFYTEKNDKLSVPIGTLKFIETVSFDEDRRIESFLTNGHLDFFNVPSDVPIGEGLAVTFKAFGQNDIRLSVSHPGVSQTDTLEETISKERYGRVTGRSREFKYPKLGDEAIVRISTLRGKDYKQVDVRLTQKHRNCCN